MKHVVVEWTDELPPNVLGDTDGVGHIRMAKGQLQVERRCTITHEMIHVERGDAGCDARAELLVRRETARRLIPIRTLGDAYLFWGDDLAALAEELWVDEDVLQTRLEHLHPAERGYLQQRLAARDGAA
jgi:hypothetical protein